MHVDYRERSIDRLAVARIVGMEIVWRSPTFDINKLKNLKIAIG